MRCGGVWVTTPTRASTSTSRRCGKSTSYLIGNGAREPRCECSWKWLNTSTNANAHRLRNGVTRKSLSFFRSLETGSVGEVEERKRCKWKSTATNTATFPCVTIPRRLCDGNACRRAREAMNPTPASATRRSSSAGKMSLFFEGDGTSTARRIWERKRRRRDDDVLRRRGV